MMRRWARCISKGSFDALRMTAVAVVITISVSKFAAADEAFLNVDAGISAAAPWNYFGDGEAVNLTSGSFLRQWREAVIPLRGGGSVGFTRSYHAGETDITLEEFTKLFPEALSHVIHIYECNGVTYLESGNCGSELPKGEILRIRYQPKAIVMPGLGTVAATVEEPIAGAPQNTITYDPQVAGWDVAWAPFRGIVVLTDESENKSSHVRHVFVVKPGGGLEAMDAKTGLSLQAGSGNVLLQSLIATDDELEKNPKADPLNGQNKFYELTLFDEAGTEYTFERQTTDGFTYTAEYTYTCGPFWDRHDCIDSYDHLAGWAVDAFILTKTKDRAGNVIEVDIPAPGAGETQHVRVKLEPTVKEDDPVWHTIERRVLAELEEWETPGIGGPRLWTHDVDAERRFIKTTDPVGNITTYIYSAPEAFAAYLQVRKIGLEYLKNPDRFFEVRYPTGGAIRYERFTAVESEDAFLRYAIVTEIPDFADTGRYFQKYYRISQPGAPATEEVVDDAVQTTVNLVDGAEVSLWFKRLKGQLLLTKRDIAANGTHTIFDYEWQLSPHWERVDGLAQMTIARDGQEYVAYAANYDKASRLSQATDAGGRTTGYQYLVAADTVAAALDGESVLALDNRKSIIRRRSRITHVDRLVNGKPHALQYSFATTDVCGNAVPEGRITKISKTVGDTTKILGEFCYDAYGNVRKRVEGPYHAATNPGVDYTFEVNGVFPSAEITYDGATARTNTLEVDPNTGLLLAKTYANGATLSYAYNAIGQLIQMTAGTNDIPYIIKHSYQLGNHQPGVANQLTSVFHDGSTQRNFIVTRTYDGRGLLLGLDRNGAVTSFDYHPTKRLKAVTSPGGRTAAFLYDGHGRMTEKLLSGLEPLHYSYALESVENAGLQEVMNLKLGGAAAPLYTARRDLVGQLVSETKYLGGTAQTTAYAYDDRGSLVAIDAPGLLSIGNDINYAEDTLTRTYPGGETLAVTGVNALGQMEDLTVSDPLGNLLATEFAYDAQHRLTSVDRPATEGKDLNDVTMHYGAKGENAEGRLKEIVDHFGKTRFWYGDSGAIEAVERAVNAQPVPFKFITEKDAFGNVTAVHYPHGLSIHYTLDTQNRVTEVRKGSDAGLRIATLAYDAAGNVTQIAYGNGVTTAYSYDLAGRVARIESGKGTKKHLDEQYTYDTRGNKKTVMHLDGSKVVYEYDGANRLTDAKYFKNEAAEPYDTQHYEYDADGNRTRYTDSVKEITYKYDADKLTTATVVDGDKEHVTTEFAYVLGNLVSQKESRHGVPTLTKTYTYDAQSRLLAATVDDTATDFATTSAYAHDYAGRREAVTVDGQTRYYGYGEALDPLVEVNAKGEVETAHIFLGSRRVAAIAGGALKIFHPDELGNVLKVTDENGAVTQTVRYDPFGHVNFLNGPEDNAYLFAGKPYDRATGLIYFGARYYDPQLGRYLTRDPLAQGVNHYLYVDNNPLVRRDLFGLFWGGGSTSGEEMLTLEPQIESGTGIGGVGGGPVGAGIEGGGGNPLGGLYVGLLYNGLVALTGAPLPSMDLGSIDLMSGGSGVSQYGRGLIRAHADFCESLGRKEHCRFAGSSLWERAMFRGGVILEQYQPPMVDLENSDFPSSQSSLQQHRSPRSTISSPMPTSGGDDRSWLDNYPVVDEVGETVDAVNTVVGLGIAPPIGNSVGAFVPVQGSLLVVDMPFQTPLTGGGSGVTSAPNQSPTGLPKTDIAEAPQFTPPKEFPTKPPKVGNLTDQSDKPTLQVQQQQVANNTKEGTNTAGDPVLLHSGDLLQSEVDLRLPGRGIDYEFRRTYRSRITLEGPLGFNWDHNFDKRLVIQANGDVARFDGDARFDIYVRQADGSYTAPPGRFDVLTMQADGTFRIRERNGTLFTYDAAHTIAAITDRNGNQLTFAYADVAGVRRLATVTDSLSRAINYSYYSEGTAAGKLQYVTDFTGRRLTFAYDAQLDLAAVTSPTTPDFPDGKTTTYTYTSGFAADRAELNHNLLTVTDAKGQTYLQNAYSLFDRVVAQRLGDEGEFTFAYQQLAASVECVTVGELDTVLYRTAVRDRSGNETITDFNCQGNPVKIAEATRSVRPGDPDQFVTTATYNLDGLVTTMTFPHGNRLEHDYAAGGGEVIARRRVPDAARGGEVQTTTVSYEPAFHQPVTITDPRGLTTTLTYDDHGNVVRIDHPTAHDAGGGAEQPLAEQFTYDEFGQAVTTTDAAGVATEYGYANGSLTSATRDPSGLNVHQVFTRDAVGNLTALTDANGQTTELLVNALNQVTQATDPLGHVTKFAYDANNNLAQIERQLVDEAAAVIDDNPWLTTQFEYNALNRLTLRKDEIAEGKFALTEYRYDLNENLTRIIQPEGNSTAITYDERDLPYQITRGYQSAAASTTTFAYDGNRNLTSVKDGLGAFTQFTYDGLDRRTAQTDPLGHITQWTYNAVDFLTQVRRRGPPTAEGDPTTLLRQLDLTYDDAGRVVQRTVAEILAGVVQGGRTTTYAYDPQHQLIQQIAPLNQITTWQRDALGRVTRVTDPAGNQRDATYDPHGQLLTDTVREVHAAQGPIARTTTYAYDAAGRVITQTDPLGHTWHLHYDSLGRLRTTIDPLDTAGIDSGATTGSGNITRLRFDGLGRLVEQLAELRAGGSGDGTLVESQSTAYIWDDNSRLTAVTDAKGNVTTYAYDALDRRITTTMADGAQYSTTYNANSWITGRAFPNGYGLIQQYDALGQLRERHIARDGKYAGKETYTYDGLGRTVSGSVYDQTNTLRHQGTFGYNAFDELLSETAHDHTITNAFNAAGDRTGLSYPGGLAVTMTPDAIGRVTGIAESTMGALAEAAYAGIGRPATITHGSGAVGEWAYDGLARLAESTWTTDAGQLLVGHQFTYNKASQILADLFPQPTNAQGSVYQYDSRSRVTQASLGVPEALTQIGAVEPAQFEAHTTYGWDAVDNFTTVMQKATPTDPATDQHISYVANALNQYTTRTTTVGETAAGTETFTYDASGNLTQDGTHSYTYTWRNQLLEVRTAGGAVVVAYDYDAFGRRVTRHDSTTGAETHYVYDGWHVIEERNAEDKVEAAYVYSGDGDTLAVQGVPGTPVAMQRGGQTYFYHADHRGSIEALTDAQGAVVERYAYDPFGVVTITDATGNVLVQSAIGNPYFFTAKRRDSTTGLYDSRARDYHPALGRFLQRDPLGYVDGLNAYAYARSNPVNFIDPWGLSTSGGQGNAGAGNPQWKGDPLDYLHGVIQLQQQQSYTGWSTSSNPLGRTLHGFNTLFYQTAGLFLPTQEEVFAVASMGPQRAAIGYGETRLTQLVGNRLGQILNRAEGTLTRLFGRVLGNERGAVTIGERVAEKVPPIIIGENMKRVKEYAELVGGQAYRPWKLNPWNSATAMRRNERWIEGQIQRGREIIDIGPDFRRRLATDEASDFYEMERRHLTNYENYRSVFERSGAIGGVPDLDF